MTALALSAVSSNIGVIGGSWMLSSTIFTTYYTNKFLKFENAHDWKETDSFTISQTIESIPSAISPKISKQLSLSQFIKDTYHSTSRSQLLTLYRFGGSLFLGLLPNIGYRIIQTKTALKFFIIPALCLFLANYCNSIALERIGISLTYTSKCAIPIVTALLTLLADGSSALPPIPALLSLIRTFLYDLFMIWSTEFSSNIFLSIFSNSQRYRACIMERTGF